MAGKSLNLDLDVCAWIEQTAKAEDKSQSELVNEIVRVCMKDPKSRDAGDDDDRAGSRRRR